MGISRRSGESLYKGEIKLKVEEIASTTARLLSHDLRIQSIVEVGKINPITIHLSPTDQCNLNCEWCSVSNRRGDELELSQCKKIVHNYLCHGAKSVEITGGGDPLMYDDLLKLIEFIRSKAMAVGLITNGLRFAEMKESLVRAITMRLNWLRISLSGLDFTLKDEYLSIDRKTLKTYVGCSYLIPSKLASVDRRLKEVEEVAKHLGARYVRFVPDCNSIEEIEWMREKERSLVRNRENFFVQIKEYRTPPVCYWRYIKPFANSDGWIYHCSTCALFGRMFSKPWRVARYDNIDSIYEGEVRSFDTSQCTLCFYSEQNMLLHNLLAARNVIYKEFV